MTNTNICKRSLRRDNPAALKASAAARTQLSIQRRAQWEREHVILFTDSVTCRSGIGGASAETLASLPADVQELAWAATNVEPCTPPPQGRVLGWVSMNDGTARPGLETPVGLLSATGCQDRGPLMGTHMDSAGALPWVVCDLAGAGRDPARVGWQGVYQRTVLAGAEYTPTHWLPLPETP